MAVGGLQGALGAAGRTSASEDDEVVQRQATTTPSDEPTFEDNSPLPPSVKRALGPYFPATDLDRARLANGLPWYVVGKDQVDAYTEGNVIHLREGGYNATTRGGLAARCSLYAGLLPVGRWAEVRALLVPLGFTVVDDREITANVVASCDAGAATRAQAFGANSAAIDNFLAVPGSAVYEQMRSGAWEYRIVRAQRTVSAVPRPNVSVGGPPRRGRAGPGPRTDGPGRATRKRPRSGK